MESEIAVWMPTVSTNSGAVTYTERLARNLVNIGVRCEITYLPHYAEFLPWAVKKPVVPRWANIVHCNSWLAQRFIPPHLPLVIAVHHLNQNNNGAHSPLQKIYHRLLIDRYEQANFKRATKIICISKSTQNTLLNIYPWLNKDKTEIIYNAVDTAIYIPNQDKFREKKDKVFRLLFVGNWSKRKGVDLLLPIMQNLGDNYHLTCISNVPDKFRKELPANITIKSKLANEADLVREYQQANALLFPSRLEGFGYVALEAQLCGTPVICSDNSSLPEIVINNETGILCETGNVSAFIEAIKYLASNENILNYLSENARKMSYNKFSTPAMLENYLKVYQKILLLNKNIVN